MFRLLSYKETNRTPGCSLPSHTSSITSFLRPALWKRGVLFLEHWHSARFSHLKWHCPGTSLAARGLGLNVSTAEGAGSIPGPGTKISNTIPTPPNALPCLFLRCHPCDQSIRAESLDLSLTGFMLLHQFPSLSAFSTPLHLFPPNVSSGTSCPPRSQWGSLSSSLSTSFWVVTEWPCPRHTLACSPLLPNGNS